MSEIAEALGTVAEGALLGRAVEPRAGEDDGHTHEHACLNCGTPLVGPHCHGCGQRGHVHRTFGAFFHDLLHGVLHFEGKTWRTLPMLAWKPGQLTREYIDGKRASYVSPIALFLFTIFVSFGLWSALGGIGDSVNTNIDAATSEQMQASVAEIDADIAELHEDIAQARAEGRDLIGLESELASKQKARRLMGELAQTTGGTTAAAGAAETGKPTKAEQGVAHWLKAAWAKAKADPALTIYKLQTNSYKLSWLLIPLSLPFMWLLFPFSRRFHLYDHTVFVTYSICFMTMLVVLASLGAYLDVTLLVVAPLLYAPYHLYRQLRGAYGLSRFGAIWRMLVLSAVIYVVLALFIAIMLALVIGH